MACFLQNTVHHRLRLPGGVGASGPCNAIRPEWSVAAGVGELCEAHYAKVSQLMMQSPDAAANTWDFGGSVTLREDYMRLYLLMLNTNLVMVQLNRFNSDFGGRVKERLSTSNYARLSRQLESYEQRCYFADTHLMALGILPANTFMRLLRSGYMLKDVGAGANHGEFTHRLQWHAVMRVMTNNFTNAIRAGWQHSPFELYSMLGEPGAITRGLWGTIFDNNGGHGYGFTNPDTLDAAIRNDAGLGFLSRRLTSIRGKRLDTQTRSVAAGVGHAHMMSPAQSARVLAGVPAHKHGATVQAKVTELMYQRKKGMLIADVDRDLLVELHADSTTSLVNRFNGVRERLGLRPGYSFQLIEGGQLLMLNGDQLVTDEDIVLNRAASRANLRAVH